MKRQAPKHGKPVATLTNPVTGEVEGWVLRWDNGDTSRLMRDSLPDWMKTSTDDEDGS